MLGLLVVVVVVVSVRAERSMFKHVKQAGTAASLSCLVGPPFSLSILSLEGFFLSWILSSGSVRFLYLTVSLD